RAFGPAAVCFLFTSWPERVYEVAGKQRYSFLLQTIADTLTIGLLWLLLARGVSPLRAVGVYAIAYCAYHATYLYVLFGVAGFRRMRLARLGLDVLLLAAGTLALLALLRMTGLPRPVQFALGFAGLGALVMV